MRIAVSLVLATVSLARADAKKDVEALVRAEAQSVGNPMAYAERTSDAVEIHPDHRGAEKKGEFYGEYYEHYDHDVDAIVVVVDGAHHVAWFHAVVVATLTKSGVIDHATWRLSGVARDDHGWKLSAIMWSRALPDAELFKLADADGSHELTMDPHDDAAAVVAGWFHGQSIAKAISWSTSAIANGTAPAEIAHGAEASKLAKAWDGLKMWATKVSGTTWGSVAFVEATIGLPAKKPKTAVMMKLGVVLVKENGNWRWVAINFAPPDR